MTRICLYIKTRRTQPARRASDEGGQGDGGRGDGDRLAERAARHLREGAPGLGVVERGAIVASGGRIVFAGAEADAPTPSDGARTVDCEGRWITPGLIDCHTHLVYAGSRAAEFEARLAGASYEDIARAGGGIVSTVRATRRASEDELVGQSLPRLDALIAEGVTTVEIKSGYGLDLETERKMLRVARRLGAQRPVEVRTTFSACMRSRRSFRRIAPAMSRRSPTRCCRRWPPRGWSTPSTASARASPSRPTRRAGSLRARRASAFP